ncbi:glycosyltransferase [Nodosilinea sp. LEGE 07298]|uniref:glycosyltransferase family 2 protein n=1 Tax=Nodosilinea sp. LEGE 07298 TaxID=2777970 RepID=UPI001882D169|nr:glycosyltransferase family 2 protein [Nodosilinea sp. LEGE 07298]MBE9111570.1 glycosyltransferase [Nodosilinea sp. LEGE 07298]
MNSTFSVVTPSYQQGRFIERTINSVLDQDISLEFIVVDGGSQDNTLDVLKKYEGQLSWISEPDDGQADAINKGIKKSSGEVIAWINSDDIYYPGTLKKVQAIFANHSDVQVVYGNADWIGENDEALKSFPTESWSYARLKESCYCCQPAVFFRRSLVDRYGNLDSSLQYCMDYELWLRFGQYTDFYFLPEKLAGSRLYALNKTVGQTFAVHSEINRMLEAKFGVIPANWLLGYALVNVEKTHGISRYDRTQTQHFVRLLVQFSCRELIAHNPLAFFKVFPKMIFWFLVPDRAWFRREDILALI